MKNSIYLYRGYSGTDVDIATSLFEYGIIWHDTKSLKKVKKEDKRPEEFHFIYGIDIKEDEFGNLEYCQFSYSYLSKSDFIDLCNESWFELDKVLDYTGETKEDFINAFPYSVYSAVSYHGVENIFGSSYYSFGINK